MITRLFHTIQIYNKYLVLFISAFIIFGSTCAWNKAGAAEFGEIQYNNTFIDYSKVDKESTKKLADFYFNKALKETDKQKEKVFLQKASGEYFIWTQLEQKNIYPIVQMARVYDLENENSFAKAYFFQALKIDKNNPTTNYYFAEYYYKREDYTRAIYFYNVAFDNGLRENYDVLIKMATMYEKLGDLLRANQYYKKAFLVKPDNIELPDKIRTIEDLKYYKTGYYNKRREKNQK